MFPRFKQFNVCALTLTASVLFGCAAPLTSGAKKAPREPSAFGDDLDANSLRTAVRYSIAYLQKIPAQRVVGEQPRPFTAKEILDSLTVFEKLLDHWHCAECLEREINARFDVVPSSYDAELGQVLFTGYYQPVIDGSLVRTDKFRYPLYGKPPDLVSAEKVTLTPHESV